MLSINGLHNFYYLPELHDMRCKAQRICEIIRKLPKLGKHTIFRLDAHYSQPYLCAVTFNNNDYGKRKSKLSGGI